MSDRPNILWICSDMLRYDAIAALGNQHVRTPNMDALIAQGVSFNRAYCQSGLCAPSRASFLTGKYTNGTRVVGNGQADFPDDQIMVTKTLADAGYDCGLIGKLHICAAFEFDEIKTGSYPRIEPRADDGYRVFHWNHDPMNRWPGGDDYHDWIDQQGVDLEALRKAGEIPPQLHQSTWCADRAIDFMNHEGTRPWLLSLNLFHPHGAFDVPVDVVRDRFDIDSLPGPAFRESDLAMQNAYLKDIDYGDAPASRLPSEIDDAYLDGFVGQLSKLPGDPAKRLQAAYWVTVEQVDQQIGRVLDALQVSGQADNTVVILHADHGLALGDHGLTSAGCRFYESDMHVPLVISCPQRFKTDRRENSLTELIDLAPTLLDLAGESIPETMHGQSLLPTLTGTATSDQQKPGVRADYYFAFDPGHDLISGTYATMWRNDQYKIMIYHDHDVGELYDMNSDPHEHNNLWESAAHREIKHSMIKACFDRCMLTIDRGPERIGHA